MVLSILYHGSDRDRRGRRINPQMALPMVVRQLNNPVVAGLIVGALLMAVMSSADSALNSSTAIFVKDLFEHQFKWTDNEKRSLLATARFCSLGLGSVAILIAILWSDIIQLLLFTYHVWAPAVILPVIIGAFLKGRSHTVATHVMIAMLTATIAAMLYKGSLSLHANGIVFFPEGWYAMMDKIDTSVFGVTVSLIAFGIARLFIRPDTRTAHGEGNRPR